MNQRDNDKRGSILKVIFWPFKSYIRIIVVVTMIGFYQYQSIRIDILAREIRNLEIKRNKLLNEKSTLEVHIDQLTNINRIEKLAKEKFELIAPGNELEQLVIKKFKPKGRTSPIGNEKNVRLAGVR